MLETKKIPVSTRTQRLDTLPRTRGASARAATYGSAQTVPRLSPRPLPAASPVTAPSRLGRSEARLVSIAVAAAILVCGLIVLYLAAYARVTLLGIDQAQARVQLRADRARNETLRAQCDYLQSPGHVAAAAAHLGMTTRGDTPVQYIVWRPDQDTAQTISSAQMNGSNGDRAQGNIGGTRTDTSKTASFDH